MKKFFYKAVEIHSGIVKSGDILADTKSDVISILQKDNLVPITISEEKKRRFSLKFKSKQTLVLEFTEYLLNFLKYKVELSKALLMTYNYVQDEKFKDIIKSIINSIKGGKSFSHALREFPEYFPSIYANLVETGEKSGHLTEALQEIYNYLSQTNETKKFIISSLTYPAILFITGIIATLLLIILVIPKFGNVFADLNQPPPFTMKILLFLSEFIKNYWFSIITIGALLIALIIYLIKNEKYKVKFDNFFIKIPVLGKVILLNDLYRFFKTLAILLKGGNSIITALLICERVVFLQDLKNAIKNMARKIRQGKSISSLMRNESIFPEYIVNLISLSETTGKLEVILENIADDLNKEIRAKIKMYLTLLEPAAVLLVGFFIGSIVLSMLSAIFGINDTGF